MDVNFFNKIPAHFHDSSRVWIYQSDKPFTANEVEEINNLLHNFTSNWKSHGDTVKGFGQVFFNQFIILMADETQSGVSGCSTDSSVHIIKQIETKFKVDLFNRQNLAFLIDNKIQLLPLSQLNSNTNIISPDTLYFNNTVLTKKDWIEKWIIPTKESWLAKKLAATV